MRRSKHNKNQSSVLNHEFNRILPTPKKYTRHERLAKGDSFICNIMIHSIQSKREFTLCCVHQGFSPCSTTHFIQKLPLRHFEFFYGQLDVVLNPRSYPLLLLSVLYSLPASRSRLPSFAPITTILLLGTLQKSWKLLETF